MLRAFDEAHTALEAALALHPERGAWWFNLGLLHKARHAFREGLAANQRARALLGDERAVLWNIAICATAAGEGAIAVEALRAIGHDAKLAPSGMPYVDGLAADAGARGHASARAWAAARRCRTSRSASSCCG